MLLSKNRMRDKLQKIILLIVSTIFSLMVCEIIARLTDLAPTPHRIRPDAGDSIFKLSENPILANDPWN